jgi:GNAT superfamily N-acetyltransferase
MTVATPNSTTAPRLRWVPVRSLAPRHRSRITAHLLALPEADRYLRFGFPASDERIAQYVAAIDFDRDEVFGIFNRRLELIAMAHLAHGGEPADARTAEFAVSVRPSSRGKGLGARLFDHAVMHARNRGVQRLIVHALSENTAMLKIARHAGAVVHRSGGDAEAWLSLPPEDFASRVEEVVETGAAELDYRLKEQAQRLGGLLDVVAEVRRQISSQDSLDK